MRVSFDFTIVSTNIDGISAVMPWNEEAYNWMTTEAHLTSFPDGSTVLFNENVGDFISDASHAHLSAELV